jgi:hypothetical protein
MKMYGGRQILLIVVALSSASWTGSIIFSTFITGNYGRSADNKNSNSNNNNYHTNGSSSTALPLQENNGSFGGSLKSFISGSVGGIMSVIVGYPLDLIKVRSLRYFTWKILSNRQSSVAFIFKSPHRFACRPRYHPAIMNRRV